jgi:diguanylate cyclase (GGDEF)-like protein
MNNHILLIDDNRFYLKAMKSKLESIFTNYTFDAVESASKALDAIKNSKYELVVCDLVLPDSSDGNLVIQLVEEGQKVIVITDHTDEKIRKKLLSLPIIDYVIKSDTENFEYLITLLRRLNSNKDRYVLIVDDSTLIRESLKDLLTRHNLNVIEAKSGEDAIAMIDEIKGLDLIITDHEMEGLDGLGVVKHFRRRYSLQQVPIIALTGSENETLIARYLKTGANDFVKKPYSQEELMCRVSALLTTKEMFEQIHKIAITDRLTGLHNRFYLYETGSRLLEMSKRNGNPLCIAILDIDYFKQINDDYGHAVGDATLLRFGMLLKKSFRKTDMLIRYGGEEFVIVMPDTSLSDAIKVCSTVKDSIQKLPMYSSEQTFTLTASMGIDELKSHDSLDSIIQRVDRLLYNAKSNGRNTLISPLTSDHKS